MRPPILLIASVLAATAGDVGAAGAKRYTLRRASLEAVRANDSLVLQAKVERKPAAKTLHEGGGYRLRGGARNPDSNCGVTDEIFRDDFELGM